MTGLPIQQCDSMPCAHRMYLFLLLMLMLKLNGLSIAVTKWCVIADSLTDEYVKELCSAAWNGDLCVGLKAMTVHKFTASMQRS